MILLLALSSSLVSGAGLDCSALAGADLKGFTGTGFSVYANDYESCVVEGSSGDCIALLHGDGRDHSTATRVLTLDIVTYMYDWCWSEVPGDVAWDMAAEYDFGQHLNVSMCLIETDSYLMEGDGFFQLFGCPGFSDWRL